MNYEDDEVGGYKVTRDPLTRKHVVIETLTDEVLCYCDASFQAVRIATALENLDRT